jgi:hypothetical protein
MDKMDERDKPTKADETVSRTATDTNAVTISRQRQMRSMRKPIHLPHRDGTGGGEGVWG